MKLCDAAMVAIFLAAIGLPLVLTSPRWETAAERRDAAPLPPAGLIFNDLAGFTKAFGDYFNDHFGLRRALIDLRNLIDVRVFRASPTPLVMIGLGDWLFYAGAGSKEDFLGRRALQPQELEAWRAGVVRRRDWLAEQGITYILAVAPNKQTVYPEFLPATPGVTRAQQFADFLRGSDVADNVVFLAPALIAAKERGDLYQHLDSHWNFRGSYVAFRAIMGRAERLAGRPLSPVTFPWDSFVGIAEEDRDLARMMGVSLTAPGDVDVERLPIPCIAVADFESVDATPLEELRRMDEARTCAGATGRILLFHDSFGNAIRRYFAGSFARLRTSRSKPTEEQFRSYVALERPDVVVELWVERNLDPSR